MCEQRDGGYQSADDLAGRYSNPEKTSQYCHLQSQIRTGIGGSQRTAGNEEFMLTIVVSY